MKLNDRQQEKAIGLRQLIKSPRPCDEKGWSAHIDFTRALAKMLDGIDVIQSPVAMKETFDRAWRAYAHYWANENDRVLFEALGSDEILVAKVKEHENGRRIVNRILARVKEQYGGINPEVNASSVEITDILTEEMDGEWSEEV